MAEDSGGDCNEDALKFPEWHLPRVEFLLVGLFIGVNFTRWLSDLFKLFLLRFFPKIAYFFGSVKLYSS